MNVDIWIIILAYSGSFAFIIGKRKHRKQYGAFRTQIEVGKASSSSSMVCQYETFSNNKPNDNTGDYHSQECFTPH